MKCDILTLDNTKAGTIDLADGVFGAEVRKDIIARMVNYQLARRRSGNHLTKTISEIRGTTAKATSEEVPGTRSPPLHRLSVRTTPFRHGVAGSE